MSELRSPSGKLPEIGRETSTIEGLSDIPLVPISTLVMTGKFPDGLSLDPGERIVVDVLEVYGKNESGKFTVGGSVSLTQKLLQRTKVHVQRCVI